MKKRNEQNESSERFDDKEELNYNNGNTGEREEEREEPTDEDEEEFEGSEEEESDEDFEEEDEETDLEGEVRQAKKKVKGYGHQVEAIAKEVIAYIKDNAQNMDIDMKTVAKYAAVAALGIYGIRKGGFLGSILVSAAASIAAKHLLGEEAEQTIPKMRKAATA
jgi:hypothetical protein